MFVRKSTYIVGTFARHTVTENTPPLLFCPHALGRFTQTPVLPKTDDGLKGVSARGDVLAIVA